MIDQETQREVLAAWPGQRLTTRVMPDGSRRSYLRFAALGDSFTCTHESAAASRGFAEILATALSTNHDVSYCHLAAPEATSADVRHDQTPAAQTHRATMAVLVAGLHDAYGQIWDTETIRYRLMRVADELSWSGATLLTVRFLAVDGHGSDNMTTRRVAGRIEALNDIYDEIDDAYGGFRLDLADIPEALHPQFWATPGLQPSDLGHHLIAEAFARLLAEHGVRSAA